MFYLSIISTITSTIIYSLFLYIPLLFIPISYFGYTYYIIDDETSINIISKKIKWSSIRNEENKPFGYFIGWYFFGYRSQISKQSQDGSYLYCFCYFDTFIKLKTPENTKIEIKNDLVNQDQYEDLYTKIQVAIRKGAFWRLTYIIKEVNYRRMIADSRQTLCISKIVKLLETKNSCTIQVSGPPGTRKSSLGILIAQELNGTLCKTFDPTDPNDNLDTLYNEVAPTKDNPLIVLLDEYDIIIEKITIGIQSHKNMHIQIKNKSQWNIFFDDVSEGALYPHIIFLLTTNTSYIEFCKKYDSSLIRKGRVDIFENWELENYYAS